MDKVFIYWDDSNIFISAQQVAVEREGEAVRSRVCIHFRNLLELTRAGREIEHAVAVGSIPPELRQVWNRLENEGVTVHLLERGAMQGREQGVDQVLQNRDAARWIRLQRSFRALRYFSLGTGQALTMASAFTLTWSACDAAAGALKWWSWRHSCNRRMREWAEENGQFIALDDFYDSVTFLERPAPGEPVAAPRYAVPVDLDRRR